jgi:hypothetical protein
MCFLMLNLYRVLGWLISPAFATVACVIARIYTFFLTYLTTLNRTEKMRWTKGYCHCEVYFWWTSEVKSCYKRYGNATAGSLWYHSTFICCVVMSHMNQELPLILQLITKRTAIAQREQWSKSPHSNFRFPCNKLQILQSSGLWL